MPDCAVVETRCTWDFSGGFDGRWGFGALEMGVRRVVDHTRIEIHGTGGRTEDPVQRGIGLTCLVTKRWLCLVKMLALSEQLFAAEIFGWLVLSVQVVLFPRRQDGVELREIEPGRVEELVTVNETVVGEAWHEWASLPTRIRPKNKTTLKAPA